MITKKHPRFSGQLHRDQLPAELGIAPEKVAFVRQLRTPKCPKDSSLGFLARNFSPKELVPHSKFSGFFLSMFESAVESL